MEFKLLQIKVFDKEFVSVDIIYVLETADKWKEIKTVAVHSTSIREISKSVVCWCGLQHLCVVGYDRKVIAAYSRICSLLVYILIYTLVLCMCTPCNIDYFLQQSSIVRLKCHIYICMVISLLKKLLLFILHSMITSLCWQTKMASNKWSHETWLTSGGGRWNWQLGLTWGQLLLYKNAKMTLTWVWCLWCTNNMANSSINSQWWFLSKSILKLIQCVLHNLWNPSLWSLKIHPAQESYPDTRPEINPTHFLCWQSEAASLTR